MNFFQKYTLIFAVVIVLLVSIGCTEDKTVELAREPLFSLGYGNFETELNMNSLKQGHNRVDTQIAMHEGLFYIANSGGKKVLELNSFGDLLSIYYNPDVGSAAATCSTDENITVSTRSAFEHPFVHPSFIAVNSKKIIYVVDTLPDERIEYDVEHNVALSDIVGWFNENGEYDYLGQEGIGGTPFPPMSGFYINERDDIIVICRTHDQVTVYWYNSSGSLLYKIPFLFAAIPAPDHPDEHAFYIIDTVIPDISEQLLYVKIDAYSEEIDPSTGVTAGINYDNSTLYTVRADTGVYERSIEIPAYVGKETDQSGTVHEFKKVYEFIGLTKTRWCFFMTPQDTGYALFIINFESQRAFKKNITVAPDELVYNTFHISSDGILSALLAKNDSASMVWWRADMLIGVVDED